MDAIEQIVDLAFTSPPPLGAPWLLGLAMYRGQVIPLIDVIGGSRDLGGVPDERGADAVALDGRRRCLVVRGRDGKPTFGLPVERVAHLITIEFDPADDAGPMAGGRDPEGKAISVVRPSAIERDLHPSLTGGAA